MASRFDPHLVNDPFGDPAVYVDFKFERRAFLFDLGDISVLPPRKLLRISDIFITHRHMDHFVGFDHLLRFVLGREKVVRLYGPAGLIDAIEAKLRAYTWRRWPRGEPVADREPMIGVLQSVTRHFPLVTHNARSRLTPEVGRGTPAGPGQPLD